MKTQDELTEFFFRAHSLLDPLLAIPGGMSDNNELFLKKYKPVFYIHYKMYQDIIRSLEYSTLDFKLPSVGKLFGIECYITTRPTAPKIALALEPIDPYFATNNKQKEKKKNEKKG